MAAAGAATPRSCNAGPMIVQLMTKDAVTGTASPSTATAIAAKNAVRTRTAVGFPASVRAVPTRIEFNCSPSPVRVIIAAITPAAAQTAATANTPCTPVPRARYSRAGVNRCSRSR